MSVTRVQVVGSKASPIRAYRSTGCELLVPGRMRHYRLSSSCPPMLRCLPRTGGSIVEPDVLVSKAVVDAIDHHGHPFYLRVAASCLPWVKDDRAGALLGQPPFDLPDQLLALFLVGLRGLFVDQPVHFR